MRGEIVNLTQALRVEPYSYSNGFPENHQSWPRLVGAFFGSRLLRRLCRGHFCIAKIFDDGTKAAKRAGHIAGFRVTADIQFPPRLFVIVAGKAVFVDERQNPLPIFIRSSDPSRRHQTDGHQNRQLVRSEMASSAHQMKSFDLPRGTEVHLEGHLAH